MNYTERIFDFAKTHENALYSISVYENGKIDTLRPHPGNETNNCYSVSKAFTVTALGMLYDAGKFDPAEKITEIFRDSLPDGIDEKWHSVTCDQVMRHCFGIDSGYLDIDTEDITAYGTDDFLSVALNRKLAHEPGTHGQYSDAAYYLMSRVVSVKSGETTHEFLRKRLFVPLDFHEYAWSECPRGYTIGATGLYARSYDIVKLGALYLGGGEYMGKRIISKEWSDIVLSRGYELGHAGANGYAKGGMYGQLVWLNPSLGIAAAWLGYDTEGKNDALTGYLFGL